jgi:glycosyltransferase involved in cell wall biosynthesis
VKVALISSGSGSRGGGELYLRFLATALAQQGAKVDVVVPAALFMDELADSIKAPVVLHRLEVTPTYQRRLRCLAAVADRAQQHKIATFLSDLKPEIVHVNQQVAEDGLDFLLGAARCGHPFLSTIHIARSAQVLGARFGWVRDLITHQMLRRIDAQHIVGSEASRCDLMERLGPEARHRIFVVRNGVPLPIASDLAEARRIARADWAVRECDVVIGSVGRLTEQKNPLFAVELLRELRALGVEARFVWIGDGPLRTQFQAVAKEAGLSDMVCIDGWRVDASLRMAGFDIFLLPSHYEGMPLALLEAMHAGLPACVSDADGMPEAVLDGVTGLVQRSARGAADWARALARLLASPGELSAYGRAARERAGASFSARSMADATLAVYRHTILGQR